MIKNILLNMHKFNLDMRLKKRYLKNVIGIRKM